MSLVLSVVQKDFFIVTTDSAVTFFPYDVEKFEETGEHVRKGDMIPTEIKSEKTHKLSNKVFLLATGMSTLTESLIVNMHKEIESDFDLKECMKVAKEVFNDLKQGKVNNVDEVLLNLVVDLKIGDNTIGLKEEFYKYLPLLAKEKNFSAYLVGFNNDGTSGMYTIRDDSYGETPEDARRGYHVLVAGEEPDYEGPGIPTVNQKSLVLPIEHRTMENFCKAMTFVHANISSKCRINVSTDCKFDIVMRVDDQLIHESFKIDTLDYYEQFGLNSL